jgi:hypothetical protein
VTLKTESVGEFDTSNCGYCKWFHEWEHIHWDDHLQSYIWADGVCKKHGEDVSNCGCCSDWTDWLEDEV